MKTGNKRTDKQSFDQELTKMNLGLAKTCDCPVSDKGGEAKDWRKSTPIRVIRSWKLKKHHPEFAPADGIRYDGLYKIVKYWPEKSERSGFIVWRVRSSLCIFLSYTSSTSSDAMILSQHLGRKKVRSEAKS